MLHRCCPNIETLYIFVRRKDRKNPHERVQQLIELPVRFSLIFPYLLLKKIFYKSEKILKKKFIQKIKHLSALLLGWQCNRILLSFYLYHLFHIYLFILFITYIRNNIINVIVKYDSLPYVRLIIKKVLYILVIRKTEERTTGFLTKIDSDRERSGYVEFGLIPARSKQIARHECHLPWYNNNTI